MLGRTAMAPPRLDEFLMASDDRFRAADLQALGGIGANPFAPGPPIDRD